MVHSKFHTRYTTPLAESGFNYESTFKGVLGFVSRYIFRTTFSSCLFKAFLSVFNIIFSGTVSALFSIYGIRSCPFSMLFPGKEIVTFFIFLFPFRRHDLMVFFRSKIICGTFYPKSFFVSETPFFFICFYFFGGLWY